VTAADRNHRMELQYDGSGLHGWAKQQGLPTVEGCLEAAFRTVLGGAPQMRVAGRTDAGVHARRQVANVHLPAGSDLGQLLRSLNALTPPGIAVTRITPAPSAFDARKDAIRRVYRYFVFTDQVASPFWARYCWQLRSGVDLAAMRECAALVLGKHDFTAFTPRDSEHAFFDRLVFRCAWKRMRGGSSVGPPGVGRMPVYLEIEADAFLRHMVRALVGTMVEVGWGARTIADFRRLLEGEPREGAGPTAPSHGLFLWDVRYRTMTGSRGARGPGSRAPGQVTGSGAN
jgi:tRNA pseudouridine38-40 synthase